MALIVTAVTAIVITLLIVLVASAAVVIHRRSLARQRGLRDGARSGGETQPSAMPPGTAQLRQQLEALIPDSCFLQLDGIDIHYVQAGQGSDIVLIHGIGASVFVWRFLFPLLQTHHRVTALDLPGFGKSSKHAKRDYGLDAQTETVVRALEQLGIQKALVVGSSMGGTISLWLAKKYPDRFAKIAVLAPATDSSLIPAQVKHFATAAPLMRKALNRKTMKLILSQIIHRKEVITDDVIDSYLSPFRDGSDGIRAFWAAMSLLTDPRLPHDLHKVSSRVLVIHGERDLMVTRRSIGKLMALLPNASLLTHPDGAHHIMEDEPAWTARALILFLREK